MKRQQYESFNMATMKHLQGMLEARDHDDVVSAAQALLHLLAEDVAKQIDAVYKAGVDVGYFKSLPSTDTIYVKPMK